jgi:glyoxylase-like metal-dependent hydrolase (beta-lactamase superfamily II)
MFTRRSFLATSSAAAAWMALRDTRLLSQAAAQAPPAGVFTDIRGGVATFTARGGTIGVFVADGALVIIDSQFADTAQVCLDGVRKRSARRIDALFNTHHHGDHTGGNRIFREAAEKIVAHANVPGLQKAAAEAANSAAQQAYPDTTFTDQFKLSLGKETIVARHYGPAHTGGDAVIFFEQANVAHMGDLIFNRRHPFIDRPGGASIKNWIPALEKVAAEHANDTRYVFGHANEGYPVVGDKADLLAMRDYLSALVEAAQGAAKKGMSRDEFVTTKLPAAFAAYDPKTPPATPNPRFGLPANLGVAFDEVSTGK